MKTVIRLKIRDALDVSKIMLFKKMVSAIKLIHIAKLTVFRDSVLNANLDII